MEGSDLNMTIAFLIVSIGWLLPIIIILRSSKTSGGEKLAWILLIIFVSWLAWIFYWLLAPIKKVERRLPMKRSTNGQSRLSSN